MARGPTGTTSRNGNVCRPGARHHRHHRPALPDRFQRFVNEHGGGSFTIRIGHGDDEGEEEEDAVTDQGKPIDLREMPPYQPPKVAAADVIAPAIPDLGLLGVLVAACFAVSFTAFLRYDVRSA